MPGLNPNTTGDTQQQGSLQQPLPPRSPSVTITMRLLEAHAIHFTWSQFLNVTWQLFSNTSQDCVTLVLDTEWVFTVTTRPSQEPVVTFINTHGHNGWRPCSVVLLTDRTKGTLVAQLALPTPLH